MKKNFKSVALFLVLGFVAVSCQKEDLSNIPVVAGQEETTVNAVYSINGEMFYTVLHGESAWHDFIKQMLALAREGYEVSFSRNGNSLAASTKEKVTYVTKSEDDANDWARKMSNDGYIVTITYDDETGEFTCVAIK